MAIQIEKKAKPQIYIQRVYKHNIAKVWDALTSKEALSTWLMPTDFTLEENATFQFTTKPQGSFDGIINCQIIQSQAPNTLIYSWDNSSFKAPTTVEWNLKAISEEETLLTLSHNGFKGFNGWITKQILKMGWKKLLSKKLSNFLQS